MTTLTTAQAAALFDVDVATIRRRIRAGILAAQKGTSGQYRIQLPEDSAHLLYLTDLLVELRQHRDDLRRQVESQRRDLELASRERAKLEELVLSLRPLTLRAGPAKTAEHGLETAALAGAGAAAAAVRWADFGERGDKKGLGASLVLTGVVAIAAGVMLHLGLRTHAVDSEVHLGYILGLVGLLLLLIGLVIVY